MWNTSNVKKRKCCGQVHILWRWFFAFQLSIIFLLNSNSGQGSFFNTVYSILKQRKQESERKRHTARRITSACYDGGVPHPLMVRGVPHPVMVGGLPHSLIVGGLSHPVMVRGTRGTPHPDLARVVPWVPPTIQTWLGGTPGTPPHHPDLVGVPPHHNLAGYPPPSRPGWGTPSTIKTWPGYPPPPTIQTWPWYPPPPPSRCGLTNKLKTVPSPILRKYRNHRLYVYLPLLNMYNMSASASVIKVVKST